MKRMAPQTPKKIIREIKNKNLKKPPDEVLTGEGTGSEKAGGSEITGGGGGKTSGCGVGGSEETSVSGTSAVAANSGSGEMGIGVSERGLGSSLTNSFE